MFKSIQEGLEVFKEDLMEQLGKYKEIADRDKKEWEELGCPSVEHLVKRLEIMDRAEIMMKVLGLSDSDVEFTNILKEIEKELGIRQKESVEA